MKTTILCYCGHRIEMQLGDFEECPSCFSDLEAPETQELVRAQNSIVQEAIDDSRYTGKMLIFSEDELGDIRLLRKLDCDGDLISLIVAGYKMNHPEWRSVYTKRELRHPEGGLYENY